LKGNKINCLKSGGANAAFTGRNGAQQSSRPIQGYGSAELFVPKLKIPEGFKFLN